MSFKQVTLFGSDPVDDKEKKLMKAVEEHLRKTGNKPLVRNFERDAHQWIKDGLSELDGVLYKKTFKVWTGDLDSLHQSYLESGIMDGKFSDKGLYIKWYEKLGSYVGVSFLRGILKDLIDKMYIERLIEDDTT